MSSPATTRRRSSWRAHAYRGCYGTSETPAPGPSSPCVRLRPGIAVGQHPAVNLPLAPDDLIASEPLSDLLRRAPRRAGIGRDVLRHAAACRDDRAPTSGDAGADAAA